MEGTKRGWNERPSIDAEAVGLNRSDKSQCDNVAEATIQEPGSTKRSSEEQREICWTSKNFRDGQEECLGLARLVGS